MSCKCAGGLQRDQEILSYGALKPTGWRRRQATRWGVPLTIYLLCAPACCAQAGCAQAVLSGITLVAISLAGVAQVVICHNHLSSQEEVSHALTHELLHAYDYCRSRDLDWSNCEHHTCSEARSFSPPPACRHHTVNRKRPNCYGRKRSSTIYLEGIQTLSDR